ncbi:MAG: acetyl-CoA carboxylase biotin carboxyl carrier protein, partial [Acetobacteraceae bacterium]|nr:acetyl-CoA carboxylase biotin carboxyl carrier protein [Acetobacteraceae bacterium]
MSGVPFDPAHVRALATILTETGLTEIEVEGKDGRIRVARAHPPAVGHTVHVPTAPAPPAAAAEEVAPAEPDPARDPARDPGAILSPMVGVA